MPLHKTLVLVNNFILNTSSFLNEFAEACESKISVVSSKINQIEIVLAVLEAKLNSIPGLDTVGVAAPPAELPSVNTSTSVPASSSDSVLPVVPPAAAATEIQTTGSEFVAIKDDPRYAPFFKMLRVGVPLPVVEGKVKAAGLNPALLSDPEASAPLENVAPKNVQKPVSRIIFDKFDVDNSGDISVNELQKMCLEFGVWLSGPALTVAMRTIDHNGDGQISYAEFLDWYKKTPGFSSLALDDVTLKRRQSLANVFQQFDTDNSGALSREEFVGLHQQLRNIGITDKPVETVIADIDSDMDGLIQFNELVAWLDRQQQ